MKKNKKIAIQGNLWSYHHVVVKKYYKTDFGLVVCETFEDTVKKLLNGTADQAVMAIENSIAGSIIPNYALIDRNELQIIG